ncbi:hypothetical protein DV096_16070 [Bradymonadaceae bacterium TMQ3]|uniref:YtxH domain-containing protein n=1 Tax=Lujinxingia sediminis TaxID=2480984 RepID=A0ABY0CRQ1_9DELT|nr:hypothetical protein [Lujinxingia sediminis]RDV37026.1 hypothetical protein DV096_16070 [Bradymonadaceae bacterium TMQ3]RVU42892.1 hypothetical protein EA187_13725 [Lujinxingia sediminis]TXC73151.1 hypothetical protein FRC91_17015 [Bradymonadales bacterium TMQ1]
MRSTSIQRALLALMLAGGLSLAACDMNTDKNEPTNEPYGSGPAEEEQSASEPMPGEPAPAEQGTTPAESGTDKPAGSDMESPSSEETTEPYGGGPTGENDYGEGWQQVQEGLDQVRDEANRMAAGGTEDVADAAEEIRDKTNEFEKDITESLRKLHEAAPEAAPADTQPGTTEPSESGAPQEY